MTVGRGLIELFAPAAGSLCFTADIARTQSASLQVQGPCSCALRTDLGAASARLFAVRTWPHHGYAL